MKKLIAVAVAMMLMLALFVPTFASAATDYSYIKVKLSSMGNPASVQFKVAGAYRIAENSAVDLFPGITYTIKAEGSGINLSYSNGASTVSYTLPSKVNLLQYTNGSSSNFLYVNNPSLGWRYYSGSMTFIRSSGTSYLQLVNNVYIETYLYGVVAYEMGNDWPAEALKAQAVCARTYAMAHIKAAPSATWHLVDTSSDQVYKGYPFVNNSMTPMQNVINAVDATRGKAIMSGDNFASGQYSASNGGQIRYTATNDPYDSNNASSPYFTYLFPKSTGTDTMNLLSSTDKAKANTMLTLLKEKLPQALLDQYGITCTANDIVINGVNSAVPTALRSGNPAGSREFTKVTVSVNVSVAGAPALAPVALVKGNGATIASGDASPATADDTDFGSVSVSGGTVSKTYTIYNTGNASLTISGITMSGTNAADFAVGTPIPTAVAAGASATFTVTFDPSDAGDRAATVNIASNDANTPYTFAVKGTGGGASSLKAVTSFSFQGLTPAVTGTINETNKTIALTVPASTDVTNLVATFEVSPGATVKVGEIPQTSGVTPNDFTSAVPYIVTAEDSSTAVYNVTVTKGEVKSFAASLKNPVLQQLGGGGMPVGFTGDVTIILSYINYASSGSFESFGEMRTRFTTYASLLESSRYWLLYQGTAYSDKCLTIVVRGYGHGKGLSQRGAQQMANEVKPGTTVKHTYQDIIGFYYSGYTISPVSIAQKALTQIPGKGSSAKWCKVTASTLNVRAAASTKGTLVGTLAKNTIVEVLSTSGSWSRVLRGSTGLVGYVSSQYLTASSAPPSATAAPSSTASPTATASSGVSPTTTASVAPTATNAPLMGRVVASSLYMRSQTNTNCAKLYTLRKGDNVIIVDANAAANWYKVRYLSYTGYCMFQNGASTYIELLGSAPVSSANPSATPTGSSSPSGFSVPTVTAKANVTSGYLTLRASASTTGTKVAEIPKGSSFTVLGVHTTAAWLKVSYSGKTGYVLAKYALISGNTSYLPCTITSALLNVRSGAGTSYGIIGTLKAGDTVVVATKVTASSGTWYKLQLGSVTGYIDSRYARIAKR